MLSTVHCHELQILGEWYATDDSVKTFGGGLQWASFWVISFNNLVALTLIQPFKQTPMPIDPRSHVTKTRLPDAYSAVDRPLQRQDL